MNSPERVGAVVIGAGVVGLAVARALAMAGIETLVVEQHRKPGQETSSRNSGVIHSGIYYPSGSMKARLCIDGRNQLYRYCAERGIAHRRCGKLIVAQAGQVRALEALHTRGICNGVSDLQWLEAGEIGHLEPEVSCAAGLLSPSTGIVDPDELMLGLLADLEAHGGSLVLETSVTGVRSVPNGLMITIRCRADEDFVVARHVINSAGLAAVDLARRIDGYPAGLIPDAHFAKGNYFTCRTRPFRHLVYPMPGDAGLGIHATLGLDGGVRFGPDVQWVDIRDYRVDEDRATEFYASIREYWPGLEDGALQPAYAGIRPKIAGPGQPAADFLIAGPADHGIPGLVNLMGIESPGLTAALAIGDHVMTLLGRGATTP